MSMKLIPVDSIPERNNAWNLRGSKYSSLLAEFQESDSKVAMISLDGIKIANVYAGLRKLAKERGLHDEIMVLQRGGNLYLAKK